MNIVFALVEDRIEEAQKMADLLEEAVSKGNTEEIDQYVIDFLELASAAPRLEMPEDQWRQFIKRVRIEFPKFVSEYLLKREAITAIITASLTENYESIIKIAKEAIHKNAMLLEVPVMDKTKKESNDA